MRLKRKTKIILWILAAAAVFLSSTPFWARRYFTTAEAHALFKNPLVLHFWHARKSFEKIGDVLFFPYYFFARGNLPHYGLAISSQDIAELNANLPKDPIDGNLANENRLFVKAHFTANGYDRKVDARYRGVIANHWNRYQKSYRIKFPKEALFNGMKALDLIIPYDRYYYVEPLNIYRAKKFGLRAPEMSFVRLALDGRDNGVYLASEHWSGEWLQKNGYREDSVIFTIDDGSPEALLAVLTNHTVYTPEGLPIWTAYNTETPEARQALTVFTELLVSDEKTFEKYIETVFDLNSFYGWNMTRILASSTHQDAGILLYNSSTGKIEVVPDDISIGNGEETFREENALEKRILAVQRFREERNRRLTTYLNDPKNLKDDLAFYDKLYAETKNDFLSDAAKLHSNFTYLAIVKKSRELIEKNFALAQNVLDVTYELPKELLRGGETDLSLRESFSRLPEAVSAKEQFLRVNPEFSDGGLNIVVLQGSRAMTKDVIVPRGLRLRILAGATLRFAKNASLVSYSPVEAAGSESGPISFDLENGSVAVLNAPEESSFEWVRVTGGGEARINGIPISAGLALYQSDATVDHAIFEHNSRVTGDDGLHAQNARVVITHSRFSNNDADGIDFDWPLEGSLVADNQFLANTERGEASQKRSTGGDAIDISGGEVMRIRGNFIDGCIDKGISIGEGARPIVEDGIIKHCLIGIAVKDSSFAEIKNTTLAENDIGISLYQKKPIFGGGEAVLSNVEFVRNGKDIETDKTSIWRSK